MNTSTVDKLIWVLIYGGLLSLCLGIFVLLRDSSGLGWTIVSAGGLAATAGAALIWVRSRMPVPASERPTR